MSLPALYVPKSDRLPPNDQWENRFEIRSESSNRVYVVAQHRTKRHWACSCPAWRVHRKCKHLAALALPAGERPHEVLVS
jgi:uncharacterized Zn finger protein